MNRLKKYILSLVIAGSALGMGYITYKNITEERSRPSITDVYEGLFEGKKVEIDTDFLTGPFEYKSREEELREKLIRSGIGIGLGIASAIALYCLRRKKKKRE